MRFAIIIALVLLSLLSFGQGDKALTLSVNINGRGNLLINYPDGKQENVKFDGNLGATKHAPLITATINRILADGYELKGSVTFTAYESMFIFIKKDDQ